MTERMIMAGWGGQGLMTLGKLLANVAMNEGKHVTYFPSYGAEVRGGTANCQVVMSDEPIYSPVVERADSLIIMNQPSYDRFESRIAPSGLMVLNTSMVTCETAHDDVTVARVPATDLANEIGNIRVANMIMLGAYLEQRKSLPVSAVRAYLSKIFTGPKAALVELNLQALRCGMERLQKA